MDRVRAWNAATGSPSSSWSIVLDVALDAAPEPDVIARRIAPAWPVSLGPVPAPRERSTEDLQRMADGPYRDGRPLVRLASDTGSVVLAAHHSVLDGLGLLALVGLVLDAPVTSGARGVDQRPAGASPLRRAVDLARRPAARLPGHGRPGARGDHLRAATLRRPDGFGTGWLAAAAARVLREAAPGEPVIAVGMSTRPGSAPSLEDASAFVRLRLPAGSDGEVADALASARPEAGGRTPGRAFAAAAPVLAPAARRVGASLLVSNLGLVSGPGIHRVAFYPAAGGRSGVAVGAAGAGGELTITVRLPRSAYSAEDAERLLGRLLERSADAGDGGGRA